MSSTKNRLHFLFAAPLALACALLPSPARAQSSCSADVDCTEAGTACGTDVCTYSTSSGGPISCVPAGQSAGCCLSDSDCKCHSLGATCVGATSGETETTGHCSFTTPDGGAGDAGSDDAGAAVDAGSGSGSGGGSGSGSGQGQGQGQGSSASGSSSGGGSGSGSGASSSSGGSGGSGCAIEPGTSQTWGAALAGIVGILLLLARGRRRA